MFLLAYLVNSVTEEIPCALFVLGVTVGIEDTAVNKLTKSSAFIDLS